MSGFVMNLYRRIIQPLPEVVGGGVYVRCRGCGGVSARLGTMANGLFSIAMPGLGCPYFARESCSPSDGYGAPGQ